MHREPLELSFWSDLMQDLPRDEIGNNLKLRLVKAGLENSDDDEIKASLIGYGSETLDTDNPVLLQRLMDLSKPYRNSVKLPHTAETIRMLDAETELRQGSSLNVESSFAGFTTPANIHLANIYRMRAYLQSKDSIKLKELLDTLPADQIMSPYLLPRSLPALRLTGETDEATLAQNALMKKLYTNVLEVWFRPDLEKLQPIVLDLQGLDSTVGIPPAFTDFIEARNSRPDMALHFEIDKTYQEKNWKKVAVLGPSFIKIFPTFYTEYWYLGRSLAELGRNAEAIDRLSVYCQYAHDEIYYPEAVALLAKLKLSGN